jgi:hypothetical protein
VLIQLETQRSFSPEAPHRGPTTPSRRVSGRIYGVSTLKERIMTIKRRYLPPMLLAVAAAASIAVAPTALAEQTCTYLSADSSVCQTPGNVQVVTSPPPVQYAPQFPYFGGNLIILHHHESHHGHGGHR